MNFSLKKTNTIDACYQIDNGAIKEIPDNVTVEIGKPLYLWKYKMEKSTGEYSSLNISKDREFSEYFELNIIIRNDNKWNLKVIHDPDPSQSEWTDPTTTVTVGEPG